jgi:gamma-glutamyltranspeptidase
MQKLHFNMEQHSGKWTAAVVGIIGGMAKYIHLLVIGDVMAINKLIEPAITAALCGFMGVLGKQLYKWAAQVVRFHVNPWIKQIFTRKK